MKIMSSRRLDLRLRPGRRKRARGFTLVELLVVIAIIGLLVALLLPAVQAAREAARRSHCSSNLKQLALAVQNYNDVHGILPPAGLRRSAGLFNRPSSGFVSILPYHDEQAIYDQWNFRLGPDFDPNLSLARNLIPVHRCPSMNLDIQGSSPDCFTRPLPSSYALSTGTYYRGEGPGTAPDNKVHNGAFVMFGKGFYRVGIDDISAADGSSRTLLIGELDYGLENMTDICCPGGLTQWAAAYPGQAWGTTSGVLNADRIITGHEYDTFRGEHPGGVYFAMVDGSVRFIEETIDARLLNALATRNAGDHVDEEF